MKRSKLRNKLIKERNIENWFEYKHQLNYYLHFLKQSKKDHFNSPNIKDITIIINNFRKL